MGANKSIHVGRSKFDVGVNLTHCKLRLKHPGLLFYSDLLDMVWYKGLRDSYSDLLMACRYPRLVELGPKSLTIKHSVSPEVGIHGIPVKNYSNSVSGGVRLSKLSIGYDYIDSSESDSTKGKATSGVYFKRFHFTHDGGRSMSTDRDGFSLTRSGGPCDNTIVISQASRFEDENDHGFINYNIEMELGTPIPPTLLTFYRFSASAARGIKLGPALFFSRVSGGTVIGSFAPYQAFAIGGPGSVRGYGEGALGVGQSCLVTSTELLFPLNKNLTSVIFLDCGSDLWSGNKVPNNPGQRHGKPGFGFGIGCGIRFKTRLAQIQVEYVINTFQQGTAYFGIGDMELVQSNTLKLIPVKNQHQLAERGVF